MRTLHRITSINTILASIYVSGHKPTISRQAAPTYCINNQRNLIQDQSKTVRRCRCPSIQVCFSATAYRAVLAPYETPAQNDL